MNEIHGKRLVSFGFFQHVLFAYKYMVNKKFATKMMQKCASVSKNGILSVQEIELFSAYFHLVWKTKNIISE